MICARFHTLPVGDVSETIHAPDRILTAKYLSSRRWDAVVFRPPFEPETHYVMRIVGLPGETVVIRDGIVIADGTPLEPPQELAGITFTPDPPGHGMTFDPVWGTDENPATLAAGEYFVLGDNTTRSRDSRLWPENATGHPPYALPAENIEGVVTHIYWPPSRVRIIR
jgi:signal peptidase I